MAIDPHATSGGHFESRLADLVDSVRGQKQAHLPGDGRKARRLAAGEGGVAVSAATLDRMEALSGVRVDVSQTCVSRLPTHKEPLQLWGTTFNWKCAKEESHVCQTTLYSPGGTQGRLGVL